MNTYKLKIKYWPSAGDLSDLLRDETSSSEVSMLNGSIVEGLKGLGLKIYI